MRRVIWAGVLTLTVAMTVSPVWASDQAAVAKAAPYVDKALSLPIESLYNAAYDDLNAYSAFTLGLALFAGRGTDGEYSEGDEIALAALDARIAPKVEIYIKAHPNDDHGRVEWRKELQATPEEISLIGRYQAAYIPEFWLGWAMSQTKVVPTTKLVRPWLGQGPNGMVTMGVGATYTIPYYRNIIDWRVYTVATQCVSAVRKATGYSLAPLNDMPLSIRLLRNYIKYDIEYRVTEELKDNSGYKGLKGAEACGTQAQFDANVAKLKSAD